MAITNYLSITQRVKVQAVLTNRGINVSDRDYTSASNKLNAPQPVNNGPAPLIARPLSIDDIKDGLEPATLGKIDKSGVFSDFYAAIKAANHDDALEVVGFWAETGNYTEGEISALTTLCSTQMPDPSWPETVPGDSWWVSDFYNTESNFIVNIDGTNYSDQCHSLLIKEAVGDAS